MILFIYQIPVHRYTATQKSSVKNNNCCYSMKKNIQFLFPSKNCTQHFHHIPNFTLYTVYKISHITYEKIFEKEGNQQYSQSLIDTKKKILRINFFSQFFFIPTKNFYKCIFPRIFIMIYLFNFIFYTEIVKIKIITVTAMLPHIMDTPTQNKA